jgi:hypothetical protein
MRQIQIEVLTLSAIDFLLALQTLASLYLETEEEKQPEEMTGLGIPSSYLYGYHTFPSLPLDISLNHLTSQAIMVQVEF